MTRCSLYRHFDAVRARRDRENLKTFVTVTTKRRRSPHNPTTVSPVGYSANKMKVSEVDRMWNAIGARLRANERQEEALADLIAKLSARRDTLNTERKKLVSL
jgi:hypothetical protein